MIDARADDGWSRQTLTCLDITKQVNYYLFRKFLRIFITEESGVKLLFCYIFKIQTRIASFGGSSRSMWSFHAGQSLETFHVHLLQITEETRLSFELL